MAAAVVEYLKAFSITASAASIISGVISISGMFSGFGFSHIAVTLSL
jgi:hypothetical protein